MIGSSVGVLFYFRVYSKFYFRRHLNKFIMLYESQEKLKKVSYKEQENKFDKKKIQFFGVLIEKARKKYLDSIDEEEEKNENVSLKKQSDFFSLKEKNNDSLKKKNYNLSPKENNEEKNNPNISLIENNNKNNFLEEKNIGDE